MEKDLIKIKGSIKPEVEVFVIPDYEEDPPEPETNKSDSNLSSEIGRLILLKELIGKFLQ